jgi:hypothetical protein
MLIRFFSSVRKKPKEVRNQYAFWIALTVTAFIAVPWFFGLPGQLASNQFSAESEPIFSSFFKEAGGRFGEVTESIEGVRNLELNTASSSSSTTPAIDVSFISDDSTPAVAPAASSTGLREVRIATTSASTTQ